MPSPRGSETLPDRLEWMRRQLAMQAKEFAESVGASKATYSNWIYETSKPTPAAFVAIYEAHGIGPDFLLLGLTGNLTEQWRTLWEMRL